MTGRRYAVVVAAGLVAAIVGALWLGAFAAAASAPSDLSGAEFADLVAAAKSDDAALQQLREVRTIDRVAVDLAAVLDTADPQDRVARLEEIERRIEGFGGGVGSAPGDIGDQELPGPGDLRTDSGGSGLGLGGVPLPVALLLAALVIGAAVYGSFRVAGDRAAVELSEVGLGDLAASNLASKDLESAAAEAAQAGEYGLALRLRFRAGLLRLHELGVIRLRNSLTVAEVARRLPDSGVDQLVARFETVVYGGDQAAAADYEHACRSWPKVIARARA